MATSCTTSSILEPCDIGAKATLRKKGKGRHSLHHARRFSDFLEDDSVMLNMVITVISISAARLRGLSFSRWMTF